MKVNESSNPIRSAAQALEKVLDGDRPTLFLSSGGSALSILKGLSSVPLKNFTVSVLDERFSDGEDRNFLRLSQANIFKGARFFDPLLPSRGSVEEGGEQFDAFLRNWISSHPNGRTVCTLGIGPDGHIAGILPDVDSARFKGLFLSEQFAVGYHTASGKFPERITSTLTFLKKIDTVIVYAAGEEKREVLRTLFQNPDLPVHRFPAQFLKTLSRAILFTDIALPS